MDGNPISWLMFFTLASGIVIGGGAFIYFLRSGYNREVAEQALIGDGASHRTIAPQGALPELLGLLAIAVVAMVLLTMGYAAR